MRIKNQKRWFHNFLFMGFFFGYLWGIDSLLVPSQGIPTFLKFLGSFALSVISSGATITFLPGRVVLGLSIGIPVGLLVLAFLV